MKLKEFDGPTENIMNINDCKKLCIDHKMDMLRETSDLIIFKKRL